MEGKGSIEREMKQVVLANSCADWAKWKEEPLYF